MKSSNTKKREKSRKAAEEHQREKRKVYWESFRQTFADVQRELHAMLERHGDLKLYEDVGRILATVRDKFLERHYGIRSEHTKEQSASGK
jgi:hypothetical protein